jgi:diguanylate cyclase (GGDEF)-like protein/PAS domain S-box-containing protein
MLLGQKNLRVVLFVSFLVVSVIPVLLLSWWVIDSARGNEYKSVEEKHLLVAKNLSLALSRYAQDTAAILEYIAEHSVENTDSKLRNLLNSQNISSLRIFDKAGAQISALSTKEDISVPKALTSAQLSAVQQAAQASETVFLPIQHDAIGQPRILIITPLFTDDQFMVAEMAATYFAKLQSRIKFGVQGHATIVDQVGNVLAHPKPEWVKSIKNISKVSAVKRMMDRETGVEQFYSPAKKADMIAGLTFVEETGWGVMVPQPVAELEVQIEQIKHATMGISSFGVLLAILISWFLSNRLTRPTQQLSAWQKAVLDSADYCVISTDTQGVIATFNKKAEQMLGYTADELIGKKTPAIFHDPNEVKQYAETLSSEFGESIEPGFEVFVKKAREGLIDEREWNYIHKNGSKVPVYLSVTALRSLSGEIIGFLGIGTDLTERKAMQAHLREAETLYHALFDNAGDAITLLDTEGIIKDCNPAALELFGCARNQFIGKQIAEFSPEFQSDGLSSEEKSRKIIQDTVIHGEQFFDWLYIGQDGAVFDAEIRLSRVEIDNKPYFQGIIRDITERKSLEKKLAFQAGHDSLTGLPNRKSLHEAFPRHVKAADTLNSSIVMMLLDLDRFKEINDTLGHHLGDQVLAQVGPRLRNRCPDKTATIARLGGDEFALIITTDLNAENLRLMAEDFVEALRLPFHVGGFNVTVGASLGVAIFPEHGENSHELLRAADVAMYSAKKRSIGVTIYDPSIDEYSTQRLMLANEINQAIQKKQFLLHYQPKINIATRDISGLEALVRWNHPTEGLMYPGSFLDIVEMSDVINLFTQAVTELAVADKKRMLTMGVSQPIAINLSARNLVDHTCFEAIESALARNNLLPSEIELELTESAVMQDPENAVEIVNKFRSRGIKTAIDDYGTGYSSLSYLRQLSVSALKIDRSFVMDMRNNTQDSAIVRSTIALAHSLDLKVIAEGVEDDETLELLKEMQCDEAQGYAICRPQPLDELITWMKSY